jgi:hypothetical protein
VALVVRLGTASDIGRRGRRRRNVGDIWRDSGGPSPACVRATTYFAVWAAAARIDAQRFLVASLILFRPSGLIFRFAFFATGLAVLTAVLDSFFSAAHLFRCASPIRFRAAALILRRLRTGSDVPVGSELPPVINCRSSAIWVSMRFFCASNPSMAAAIMSLFSFVGIYLGQYGF